MLKIRTKVHKYLSTHSALYEKIPYLQMCLFLLDDTKKIENYLLANMSKYDINLNIMLQDFEAKTIYSENRTICDI